ncbi:T9SS type A sorting domain-containing protein [Kordia sp.]|uniref:T9SS type A sorting domain-containing protein n=1 Tax=Kordia sp. TaxID=1965332 RepID=UPI003B5BD01F
MHYKYRFLSFVFFFFLYGQLLFAQAWSYVGIPYTDWTYDPFTIELSKPSQWPMAAAEKFYYVAPDHPNATDAIINGELTGTYGRYGYPDKPRLTIPSNGWIGDTFEAGTVIWLKGGTYGINHNFYGTWSPEFHGTSSQPVWIHGDPDDKPTFKGLLLGMYNSRHTIVDNIQWNGDNTTNTVLTLTRDRAGATHHITLKNLLFENLDYIGGGGAIVGLTSNTATGAELHDVVAYNNVFKNCGGGYDWSTNDNDQHAYKVNGTINGNEVYRVWIVKNNAVIGDTADPVDGLYKSLSGNLVQVGDQIATSGGNHHVFVAGNYQEFSRQALGWTKRASDVIFSSNHCTDTYALAGGNGQAFGHQYNLGSYNWWIANIATRNGTGWQHTANDPMEGPLFIIGNLFYNNRDNESNTNWRLCSGITLFSQHGEHYIINNVFDNSCHGIWSGTNRHGNTDKLHIYNNIFTNISATVDQSSRAMTFDTTNGMDVYLGNNLFDSYNGDVRINGTNYVTINDLNNQTWATNNITGAPLYIDANNENYDISQNSPAIDNGTQTYIDGSLDAYQQYIDRYSGDPQYPGNPQDYWPEDILHRNRIVNGVVDIGAHEYGTTLSVTDDILNPNIKIYPNPTDDIIHINLGNENFLSAILYDVSGKKIKTIHKATFSLKELSQGVYIIKIFTQSGNVSHKRIIKQ